MCKHENIYHIKLQAAYCKDCKRKVELDKGWTKRYESTVKVGEYVLKK